MRFATGFPGWRQHGGTYIMENSALVLFVPYSAADAPWVVRRARTVVESWPTREQAVMGAFGLAADLSRRMGSVVRIEIQEADGAWHALSPVNAHKSARTYASLRRKPPAAPARTGSGSA